MSNKSQIVKGARIFSAASLGFIGCSMLSGCLISGFGTTESSLFWPGGIAIVVILALLLWFLCRTR